MTPREIFYIQPHNAEPDNESGRRKKMGPARALTSIARMLATGALLQVLLATPFIFPAAAQSGANTVTAPIPPARPFDLKVLPPTSTPIPQQAVRQGSAAPSSAQPSAAATSQDPPPRLTAAPVPPQRPEPRRSNPADEESEPVWPRRTPGQAALTYEPPTTPAPAVATGVTTDPGTSVTCLPPTLKRVMAAVAQRYGGIHVTSTFRGAFRARRNSFHRRCMAMDFRVHGHSPRAVLAFVKSLPETGGHKVYWNGLVHVDVGPWRTW
jgi:hypothetical protein